jgi:hypothetical protein
VQLAGLFLFFMPDVNLLIEDCFFIDVGAFRECFVRFFCLPKKKTPEFRYARRGRQKGRQTPSLRGFYSQSLVAF